jgi:hypothetical protein
MGRSPQILKQMNGFPVIDYGRGIPNSVGLMSV